MASKKWAALAAACALVMSIGAVGCSNGSSSASSAADSASAEAASSEAASSEASSASAAATTAGTSLVDNGGMYVSVDWLAKNLDDVVVVDARDAGSYGAAHIPGAVNLTWQQLSHAADRQIGEAGWAELNDVADIAAAAAQVGIDGTKPVVVYTDVISGWGEDGRVMWTLGEAGVEDVKVLDGGWRKWVGSGNATEDGTIVNGEPVEAIAADDADPIDQVDEAFVKEHIDDAVIVDARMAAEYDGDMVIYESRMGRIPNAVSVPNVSLFNNDGTVKAQEELDDILSGAGLTDKDALVVTYCTGGVRGANVAEVLSDLGFTNVKVYTAGFAEWAGDSSCEVEDEAPVPDKAA